MEPIPALLRTLRWYTGREDIDADATRVLTGHPLALLGGTWDDLPGFASRLAPERAVVDLRSRRPSAREVHELRHTCPDAVFLSNRAERVVASLGFTLQPWYIAVAPLSSRPGDAMPLLRDAIADLGVTMPLDRDASSLFEGLATYRWPRGLHELRDVARRVAALLDGGTLSDAARRLSVTRQALSKYFDRRTG